ncbi:MAG: hypothetical protein V4662_25105 [Verrucomicrobiota bacterium]
MTNAEAGFKFLFKALEKRIPMTSYAALFYLATKSEPMTAPQVLAALNRDSASSRNTSYVFERLMEHGLITRTTTAVGLKSCHHYSINAQGLKWLGLGKEAA